MSKYKAEDKGSETFLDSQGIEHILEKSPQTRDARPDGNSPYDCLICGEPANSPASKRYCWEHYKTETDGKVFD